MKAVEAAKFQYMQDAIFYCFDIYNYSRNAIHIVKTAGMQTFHNPVFFSGTVQNFC